jgi:hypothetical protein
MQNYSTKNAPLDMAKWREIIEVWNKSAEHTIEVHNPISKTRHLLSLYWPKITVHSLDYFFVKPGIL